MTKYLYKSIVISPSAVFSNKKFAEQLRESINQRANTLGEQGYELATTTLYGDNKFLLVFKKKVVAQNPEEQK